MGGAAVSPYGSRSKYEKTARFFNQNTKVRLEEASSRTPLHDTCGIITPSSLHFERHHSGVPEIDPATHTLTIHGLVDRPLAFTVADLKRMPSVSRIHFLECSGNSTLPQSKMPNREGFVVDPRLDIPVGKRKKP
ncbi:MAG: molybdopterin-dependent oxidoreductase [Acidobacteria bacterium]|nr:molybdopterin-dependent oxidoreductase [Acidobacteriota bacterium]